MVAAKDFKVGVLKLHPVTNMVVVAKTFEENATSHFLGEFTDAYKIFLKGSNALPAGKEKSEPNQRSLFVSKFFCVRQSHDQNIVNCELRTKDVEVLVGTAKYQLALPFLTNTKDIASEVELVYLSNSIEPVQKKPRLSDDGDAVPKAAPKGKGSSKSSKTKGKGKGKAKAKS